MAEMCAGHLGARRQAVAGRWLYVSHSEVRSELCDHVQCQHVGRAQHRPTPSNNQTAASSAVCTYRCLLLLSNTITIRLQTPFVLALVFVTPPPIGGQGFVFARFLCFFVCFFVSNITRKRICMKFSGKVWSDHGTTWFNFESIRVNGSAGRRSSYLLSPAIAQSQLHSLGGSRGLALTSQLHRWQQGAGFVVPRTTACYIFECGHVSCCEWGCHGVAKTFVRRAFFFLHC